MKQMRRDQRQAAHAYACVREVPADQQDEYRIAVDTLGPALLRTGLCAAFSFLQRRANTDAVQRLFKDLANADIPGLTVGDKEKPEVALPERAWQLELEDYMLASRELLLVTHWFKRAIQATFKGD